MMKWIVEYINKNKDNLRRNREEAEKRRKEMEENEKCCIKAWKRKNRVRKGREEKT